MDESEIIDRDIVEVEGEKDFKLYSAKSIAGATFLGGPLVAGYMIGENYKSIEEPSKGLNSLIIGIVATILLFAGLFMIPADIIDKIPSQLIPFLYIGIIWAIVEWKQGKLLKSHKEKGKTFHSGWRAAGIGLISLVVMGIGIFSYAYFGVDNSVYEHYDSEIAQFTKNETETLVFYDHINTEPNHTLIQELDDLTIPKWKENVEIMESLILINDLPSELVLQNKILLKYSQLRLEAFELIRKAIQEDTEQYTTELEKIHEEINEQLEKLNQ